MKLIRRIYYLNKIQLVKDIPDIKVITGLRRSDKSKLLFLVKYYYKEGSLYD
ncbi:MAG: hypothetical protein SPE24_04270 [Erysipelotrichaceae bacterium]|nr:hypothetical protein [Erysipelotrichaceae bacterium]